MFKSPPDYIVAFLAMIIFLMIIIVIFAPLIIRLDYVIRHNLVMLLGG